MCVCSVMSKFDHVDKLIFLWPVVLSDAKYIEGGVYQSIATAGNNIILIDGFDECPVCNHNFSSFEEF